MRYRDTVFTQATLLKNCKKGEGQGRREVGRVERKRRKGSRKKEAKRDGREGGRREVSILPEVLLRPGLWLTDIACSLYCSFIL